EAPGAADRPGGRHDPVGLQVRVEAVPPPDPALEAEEAPHDPAVVEEDVGVVGHLAPEAPGERGDESAGRAGQLGARDAEGAGAGHDDLRGVTARLSGRSPWRHRMSSGCDTRGAQGSVRALGPAWWTASSQALTRLSPRERVVPWHTSSYFPGALPERPRRRRSARPSGPDRD